MNLNDFSLELDNRWQEYVIWTITLHILINVSQIAMTLSANLYGVKKHNISNGSELTGVSLLSCLAFRQLDTARY
jgi:hypothetical protein